MIPVEGHKNLFRDETSGAIINHDSLGYSQYKRLIVSRPVQPMGKDIGFLPGDINDKMIVQNLFITIFIAHQD